jgi:hypothetical protein
MGRVLYDGQRLIPAPLVNITKSYQTTEDGTQVGSEFALTIQGTIVAYKGSPTSSGTFHTAGGYPADEVITTDSRLAAIERKQDAIRALFADEGKQLEFQSNDGSQPIKCNPRILSVEFPEGRWHDTCDYVINCTADVLNPENEDPELGTHFISSATENWSFETDDGTPEGLTAFRSYRLTHTIDVQGKTSYDDTGSTIDAWREAKDFALARLGLDSEMINSSGVSDLPSYYTGYNHVRNESIDKLGGGYSVTETWVLASGNALEDFTISTSTNSDETLSIVSIDGNITGLEERNSSYELVSSKWDNANTKYSGVVSELHNRAQTYSNLTLNLEPQTTTVGKNPVTGTINYTYEYNDRPSNAISGSKSEVISVNYAGQSQSFAAIPVLGRSTGPVLQSLGTSDARTVNLNMEVVFPPETIDNSSISSLQSSITLIPSSRPAYSGDIQRIIDAVNPSNNGFTTVFQGAAIENWNPSTSRYSLDITWTYE